MDVGSRKRQEQVFESSAYFLFYSRSVAQPGRALPSGGRGRRFESSHSDHYQ